MQRDFEYRRSYGGYPYKSHVKDIKVIIKKHYADLSDNRDLGIVISGPTLESYKRLKESSQACEKAWKEVFKNVEIKLIARLWARKSFCPTPARDAEQCSFCRRNLIALEAPLEEETVESGTPGAAGNSA